MCVCVCTVIHVRQCHEGGAEDEGAAARAADAARGRRKSKRASSITMNGRRQGNDVENGDGDEGRGVAKSTATRARRSTRGRAAEVCPLL